LKSGIRILPLLQRVKQNARFNFSRERFIRPPFLLVEEGGGKETGPRAGQKRFTPTLIGVSHMKKSLIALAVAGACCRSQPFPPPPTWTSTARSARPSTISIATSTPMASGRSPIAFPVSASRVPKIWRRPEGRVADRERPHLRRRWRHGRRWPAATPSSASPAASVPPGRRHDTPYKLAGSADVFVDTAADAQDTAGIIGSGGFDTRAANTIAYISPDFSGFHFAAATVPVKPPPPPAPQPDAKQLV